MPALCIFDARFSVTPRNTRISIPVNKLLMPISLSGKEAGSFPEKYLQELLDLEPRLLPVRDFYRTVTSLFSLGSEIPVDLGNQQGYIDNLFVTNDAHLVLVETKLRYCD